MAGIRINRYQGQNKLVIPVYSRNEQTGKTELVNVQQIDEQGEKRFLYGGQKSGGYAILNGTHADMAQGFYIAEGYATAASVHWATGKPVVIAFDAGNLPVVAARIAERDNLPPETPIYLAADNDRVSQTGLEKAIEAAAWLGERAQIRLPEFDANDIATWQQKHGQLDKDGKEQFPSDFNDLMELRGLNAIQTAIHAPLSAERIAQVATMQPEINNHIANFKKHNIQPNRPFQFKTLPLDEAGLRFRAQYVLEKFGNEKHRHALIAELAKRGIDIRAQVAELSGQSYRQPETAKLVPQANLTAGGEIPFTQAVDNVVSGKVPAGYIQLGTTPDVLQMLGVPQGKVRISGGTIEKAVADYLNRQNTYDKNRHAVNPDDLKLLPSEMNDPIAVFKSSSRADSFVVLTQLYEREHGKEKPIIAAVHLSKGKGKHGANLIDVVSVYGRSDTQLERAFQDDLLYINAKKVREFLTTHPLQLHWDITSKTELSYRHIKSETDLAQWKNAHRQPEKPLQSPLPNPSQSQNSTQTEKENPMAQQPTPNEIQRHAQNVAQMADAAEREAVMREMAERGIHVRSEVNKILAERAAEMPQQPENEQSATSHTFADELSALNLPSDFSFEYQVLQPNGREIARVHLAGYGGELMVDKIEAEKGGGYVAKSDNILDGMAIHSDNLPNLMREMTFQMRQAAEREQHQEPTTTQPDRQPEKEPPQPTAANHAAVAVSEPPETQAVGQSETPPPHYSEQILTQLAHQYGWTIDDTQTASKIYANANPADGALNPNGNLTLHARFDESHRYLALESGWDTVFDIDARDVPPPVAAQVLNQFAEQAAFNTPFERGDVETTIRQETGKYYLSQGLQQQGYEPSANNTMWAKTLGDDTIHIALSPNEVTVSYASPHTEPQLQKFSIQDVDGMMERVQQYEQQAQSHFRQPENQQGELLQSSNQQENTMLAPENRLVFTTREAAVEYEAINRVIQVTMLEEMNRVEPHPDGVTNAVQYLQDLLTQNKAQLAHETDKEQREALQNDIDVGAMAISLMQQGLSSPQLQQRAENLLAEAQRVPAVEVENSIEFGGITQKTSQSLAQSTEAQPQRETISAAEVQENLRRAKEKERIEQAQQFTQETAVGAAIGMAADVALDAAIPGSSMAKTAASVAAGLAGDAAAERALQQNPTQKTERDAENAEKQPEIKQPQPILDHGYAVPSHIQSRYIQTNSKLFGHLNYSDINNHTAVVFQDKGNKLSTPKNDAQTISDMLDVAQAKNWGSIKISGSAEFKRQMWLEANLRGIATSGYKPSKEDLALLANQRENRSRNSIEHQPLAPEPNKPAQEAPSKELGARLVAHGKDHYNHNPDKGMSYFVLLEKDGKQWERWGMDLERAMKESSAQVGDKVELIDKGKDGKRNSFEIQIIERTASPDFTPLRSEADKQVTQAQTTEQKLHATQIQEQVTAGAAKAEQPSAEQRTASETVSPDKTNGLMNDYHKKLNRLSKDDMAMMRKVEVAYLQILEKMPHKTPDEREFMRRSVYQTLSNMIQGNRINLPTLEPSQQQQTQQQTLAAKGKQKGKDNGMSMSD